ncbi:hypothetical protein GCM10009117_22440 [Gangjinia marincola]|uniref:Signal transduction histidine kinase internal region domain-containing protein n=2 Tax=Gangjinia marincola TaxID=578463 RepID=A0ABP3XXG2_9FLAO
MGATYVTVYYLIPQYLLTRRYGLFTLYSAYTIIFTTYAVVLAMFGSFIFLSNFEVSTMPPMSRNVFFILILIFLVVGLVSFMVLLRHSFKTSATNKALQNKILDTQLQLKQQELQYLKRQLHPHFLFNSLNTIYGFALKNSLQTPDIILKFSNLLDYILYQVQEQQVTLEQELAHIKEYISLEELRFPDTLEVDWKLSDSALEKYQHLQLPPMLFLPFVENAFKHGTIINGTLRIGLAFNVTAQEIMFTICNSFRESEHSTETGIGLPNIKKRLELLFPQRHQFEISAAQDQYSVSLTLQLKNHAI